MTFLEELATFKTDPNMKACLSLLEHMHNKTADGSDMHAKRYFIARSTQTHVILEYVSRLPDSINMDSDAI